MAHFLCHLHDFPFLGMICCGLYNFCLLACFLWGLFQLSTFQIQIVLCVFYAFFDTLPMIVFSNSDSILIKSYKIICRPSLPGALRVLLQQWWIWRGVIKVWPPTTMGFVHIRLLCPLPSFPISIIHLMYPIWLQVCHRNLWASTL
jgi:hypothetical protein